jgi:hypothetical protein
VPGLITSPINGQLFQGTTTQTVITVSGTYTGTSPNLTVQIMDPSNNNQWTPEGAASVQAESFTTTIGPFNGLQWPQGGVLSLQVVDGNGVPLSYQLNNDTLYTKTTVYVGSPGQNPTDWTFLTQQPLGATGETALYYQTIGAPQTLSAFEQEFFPNGVNAGGAANALFFNKADLAVGRDMSCNTTQTGGVACFVRNLGAFDGDENTALADLENPNGHRPINTFAMIYNPPITNTNAVQFIVYDGNGNLDDAAQLDTSGNNTSVPQACLNCHGAQAAFNAGTAQVTGAQFLQVDPQAMDFNENVASLTFAAQQNSMFQLEQIVSEASPSPTTRSLIAGEWVDLAGNATLNTDFIPGAWNVNQHASNLYTQVIAPFCRGCHASVTDDTAGLAFSSPADFLANSARIVNKVCGAGPNGMPVSQAGSTRFFGGVTPGCNEIACTPQQLTNVPMSARALVVEYLGAGSAVGACALGQPL